jgi:GR25 family glycosyltransferase involved in LPS biosynthesis
MQDINTYVDKVFYINMDKDVERNDNIIRQFKKHGIWNYERISGVVIDQIPDKHEMTCPDEDPIKSEKYIKSSFGCLNSHKKAIEIAVERNYSRICVFEDDITLVEGFVEKFNQYITALDNENPSHQIAYLGIDCDREKDLSQPLKKLRMHCYGAYAYILSNQDWVFKYVLQNIDYVVQEIDLLYNSMILQNALSDCYVTVPNIVLHEYNYGSNINTDKNNELHLHR